jgi:hypothetical protein
MRQTSCVPAADLEHRGERMAGRQRGEFFRPSSEEGTLANEDRTDALLRKSCEGRFEIAIAPGIRNKELQAQRARRRLQVCDDGLCRWKGRVDENAEQGSIGHQVTEQLQLFRRQFGP